MKKLMGVIVLTALIAGCTSYKGCETIEERVIARYEQNIVQASDTGGAVFFKVLKHGIFFIGSFGAAEFWYGKVRRSYHRLKRDGLNTNKSNVSESDGQAGKSRTSSKGISVGVGVNRIRKRRPAAREIASVDEGPFKGLRVMSFGSGFLISTNGLVATNYHVVEDFRNVLDAGIRVRVGDRILNGWLVASDERLDLAIVKIEGCFEPLEINLHGGIGMGEAVFAIGFPDPTSMGFSPKVTKGVISSLTGYQDSPHLYQFDAAIQPGSSGGALLNEKGEVIGVVVASLSSKKTLVYHGYVPQNVNYAVKSTHLVELVGKLPEALQVPFYESRVHTVADVLKSCEKSMVQIVTVKDTELEGL